MASPGLKRTYEATLEPSPSDLAPSSIPTPLTTSALLNSNENVPTTAEDPKSAGTRESTPLSSAMTNPDSPLSVAKTSITTPPPVEALQKRRKLTFAEKEVQMIERQFKEQQRAEEKFRKEEEKRAKEEQKKAKDDEREKHRRLKDAEREEKRKAKEAKDAVKEEEKQKKEADRRAREDEKAKKDKSQSRLSSFFAKPAVSVGSVTSSRRSSVASVDIVDLGSRVGSEAPEKYTSDYEKSFPSFFLHTYTTMAPTDSFNWDAPRLETARRNLDKCIANDRSGIEESSARSLKRLMSEALSLPATKRRRFKQTIVPVKDLIARVNGTVLSPVELTEHGDADSRYALEALRKIPLKYLRYAEDVRPPYIGTFTKLPTGGSISGICRNPFARALPAVNYDYDSEAEWEEPEEGEDLNSEGEEEAEDEEGDDMEGFLDDEESESSGPKRRNVMGEMDAVCTILHWDSSDPRQGSTEVAFGKTTLDLDLFRLAPLLVEAAGPIDPYSTTYWNASPNPASSMAPPPRLPLNPIQSANGSLFPELSVKNRTASTILAALPLTTAKTKASVPTKPMPTELIDDFKRAINGSDLTKAGLIEVLKKRFPQVTKNTVQETLLQVARRDGKKEAEKKWVLI